MVKTDISEASLSRVWRHIDNDDTIVGIFSAFRGENSLEKNLSNNKIAASKLRSAGYGFFFVDGFWVETTATGEDVHVKEDAIFATAPASQEEEFTHLVKSIGEEFNQQAVIIKNSSGIILHDLKDGSTMDLGKMYPGRMGTMYTKLKNNKRTNTFVFESERLEGKFEKLVEIIKKRSI